MHGRKRNSDTSPAGLWSLGLAFGNSQKPAGLKMPWRDVTPNTDWVCDADSIYFNTWQERDDPTVTEAWSDDVEHLEDYPNAYAYACVIRFNTPPYTIPERGCAIFFHCSKGRHRWLHRIARNGYGKYTAVDGYKVESLHSDYRLSEGGKLGEIVDRTRGLRTEMRRI